MPLPRVTGELHLIYIRPGWFRLGRPLWIEDETGRWAVPAEFETDLASVPRAPLAYLLFGGRGARAAPPHDYLYRLGLRSRAAADKLFHGLLLSEGETKATAAAMYRGVRLFAGPTWRKYRRARP